MGGKQKQSQRTKGNVKASSSARAAQVLESMGGFQGFGALGGDLGFVPVAQATDDPDSTVDSDFRMLLRKLTKKDTTTKVKALQDIASLCKEKSVDEIKSVLPFWPRIYARLSIDHERRVREAIQLSHKELVSQVGRDMAPYLKTIVGPWLVARGDPYGPAASAASAAFTEAFSAHKQKDVLLFCKKDIMKHLEDNILKQTAETLSDKSTTDPEDMQSKYERTVASSLSAWKTFLLTVPPQIDLLDTYSNILTQQFWKLSAHQSELIRASFYSLLSGLCQIHPDIVSEGFSEKVCTCTLYKLDETSTHITPALWEAALYAVSVVEDWYQKINPKKGFLPKLFKVLSVAGEISCQIIFPSILPLLSKLPSEVLSGKDTYFLEKYCESIMKSLLKEGESKNQRNIDTIIVSFIECIRFCILKNIQSGEEGTLALLTDKLGDIVKASIRDDSPCLSESPLYSDIASLIWYLAKQETDTKENSARSKTLSNIWTSIEETCLTTVFEPLGQDKDFALKRVGLLIRALHPEKTKVKLKENEPGHDLLSKVQPSGLTEGCIDKNSKLFQLACQVCKAAYNEAMKTQSEGHLQLLCGILRCYRDPDLLGYLKESSGDESVLSESENVEVLVDTVFLPLFHWVNKEETMQGLMSIIVDLLLSLNFEHVSGMLEKVLARAKSNVFHVCILTKTLLNSSHPNVLHWLSGSVFGSLVVEYVTSLCDDVKSMTVKRDRLTMDDRVQLFQLVLNPREGEGSTLSSAHIDNIVTHVHTLLPSEGHTDQTNREMHNNCIALACELSRNIFLCRKLQDANTECLLIAFFKLDCLSLSDMDGETRIQVSLLWQEVITKGLLDGSLICEVGSVIFKAVNILKDVMLSTSVDMKQLENQCSIGKSLLLCIGDMPSRLSVFKTLLMPFVHPEQWNLQLVISGKLPMVTDKPSFKSSASTGAHKALAAVYFSGKLHETIRNQSDVTTDMEDDASFIDYQMQLCLGLALCEINHVKGTPLEDVSSVTIIATFLEEELSKTLRQGKEVLLEITRRLLNLSLCDGGLWVQGLRVIIEKAAGKINYVDLESILGPVERLCEVESDTRLHTNLVAMTALSQNELQDLIGCCVASIMSLPAEDASVVQGYAAHLSLITTAVKLLCEKGINESVKQTLRDVRSVVTVIQGWKEQFDALFLFESSLVAAEWGSLSFCAQCIRFLSTVVQYAAKWLSLDQWDFVMCGMLSWLQSCQESTSELLSASDCSIHMFSIQTFTILKQISLAMEQLEALSTEEQSSYPPELHNEWLEFFSQGAFGIALPLLIQCADAGKSMSSQLLCVVCDASSHCPVDHLLHQQLPPKLLATDQSPLPDSLQTLLNYFTAMMLLHSQPLQLVAYTLLVKLVPEISKHEEKHFSSGKEKEVEMYRPPQGLWDISEMCKDSLMTWFTELGLRIADKWEPGEHSVEQSVTMAYLYSWMVLLELCKQATPTMRACYAAFLRDNGAIDALMNLLFCTMPRNPVISSSDKRSSVTSPTGKVGAKSLFAQPLKTLVKGYWTEHDVKHMACSLYFSVLEELPALVRQWYVAQDRRVTELTDRFTSKYVSPLLCDKQLTEVRQEIVNSDTLKVRTRPVTREVLAVYSVDDASIELVVTLPPNHPLGPVTVEQGKKIGIANNEWRNWMLQLTTFLQHQNGTIMKGLLLWKRNVDKKFEGVEECYICFSIIHGTTCQLPKLQCKTCKKKFHSSCLYKWFTTSNKATCPLCRNLF